MDEEKGERQVAVPAPSTARRAVGGVGAVVFLAVAVTLQMAPDLLEGLDRAVVWGVGVLGAIATTAATLIVERRLSAGPGGRALPSSAGRPPAELPPYSRRFTGREEIMGELRARFRRFPRSGVRRLLARPAGRQERAARRAPLVIVVTGAPGTGKTQLVTQIAHEVADRFPDGDRWVELFGDRAHDAQGELEPEEPQPSQWPAMASPRAVLARAGLLRRGTASPGDGAPAALRPAPRRPERVLVALLESFGRTPRTDAPLRELKTAWRALTNTRRLLIVLDNAKDAAQVEPLLPNGGRCAVLVTSRRSFADAAFECERYELDGLDDGDGVALLNKLAPMPPGADEEERRVRARIVARCHGLPLGIRLCGGVLSRPGVSAQELLADLDDVSRTPLLHASGGFAEVIALSLQQCRPRERLLLRRVADTGLHEFADWSAAALLETTKEEARGLIDELHARSLVAFLGRDELGVRRYRLHDLVRDALRVIEPRSVTVSAGELASWSRQATEEAVGRLLTCYTWLAEQAARAIGRTDDFSTPPIAAPLPPVALRLSPPGRPGAWLTHEIQALRTCLRLAEERRRWEDGWRLARAIAAMCQNRRVYWRDWEEATRAQLRMAYELGDRQASGMALLDRAEFTVNQGDYERGAEYAQTAQTIFEQLGEPDPRWLARSWRALGVNLHRRGDLDDGLRELSNAEKAFAAAGERWWRARTLCNLADLHSHQRRHRRAQALLRMACTLFRAEEDWEQYNKARLMLAEVLAARGRHLNAWYMLTEARRRFEAAGEQWYVARCLRAMGELETGALRAQYDACDLALNPARRAEFDRRVQARVEKENLRFGPQPQTEREVLWERFSDELRRPARRWLGEYWAVREFEFTGKRSGRPPGWRFWRAERSVEEEWSQRNRLAMLERAIEILERIGDVWGVCRTKMSLGRVLMSDRDPAQAIRLMSEAAEGFAGLGDRWWHARAHRVTARALYDAGHHQEALEPARLAYEAYHHLANHTGQIRAQTLLGTILLANGDLLQAATHLRGAVAKARANGEDWREMEAHRLLQRLFGDEQDEAAWSSPAPGAR
ncbi:hypothetical protein GCM10027294_28650 [Marinactinospora endophytica]